MKFTIKPIEATQWWKHGDHDAVQVWERNHWIDRFPSQACPMCGNTFSTHGGIPDGGLVCPGSYVVQKKEIINGVVLESLYVVSQSFFESRYEPLIEKHDSKEPS